MVFAQSDSLVLILVGTSRSDIDLRKFVQQIAEIVDGKGGGRPDLVEIGGENKNRIVEEISSARCFLLKQCAK